MRESDRPSLSKLRDAMGESAVARRAPPRSGALRATAITIGALVLLLCGARTALAWHSGRGAAALTQAQAIAVLRDIRQAPEQHRAAVEVLRQHAAQAADVLAEFARGAENAMVRQHAKNAVQDVAARLR